MTLAHLPSSDLAKARAEERRADLAEQLACIEEHGMRRGYAHAAGSVSLEFIRLLEHTHPARVRQYQAQLKAEEGVHNGGEQTHYVGKKAGDA